MNDLEFLTVHFSSLVSANLLEDVGSGIIFCTIVFYNFCFRAAEWKLDEPNWTGRMRLVAVGKRLELRLEDKTTGQLFANCPIDEYPGICIEPVIDSSRYFVIRLRNDNGQTAFIG